MKKVYYTNVCYAAIVKFQHENGEVEWVRSNNLNSAEAKRMYVSVNQNIGAEAHLIESCWFYGHLPNAKNGTIQGILLEEIRPFYFEY